MPTNDGVQLVRGSGAEGGAEGGSRREFVPFARFSVLSGLGGPGWGGSHACFAPYCAGDVVLETGCKFGRPVSASAAVISDHNSGFSRRCAGLGISVGTRRRPAEKQHVAAPGMWTRCCGDDTQSRSLACVYAHLTTGEPRSAASAASWGRSRAQLVLSRVPGPQLG